MVCTPTTIFFVGYVETVDVSVADGSGFDLSQIIPASAIFLVSSILTIDVPVTSFAEFDRLYESEEKRFGYFALMSSRRISSLTSCKRNDEAVEFPW